jgi:predicted porin
MKKSLFALAALTAFAGVASAQSSVTAFGIIDLAARNVKNGNAGSIKSLSSGGQATSRFGFRGVEDLGGGLRAGFWIESEVGPDTGAAGSTVGSATNVFWARRSTISLMGGFGEVRLGRDWTPTYSSFNTVEIFGYVGVASPANLRGAFYTNAGSGTASAVRQSNTVAYFLPNLGGLTGQVQVSAGEGAANQNKSMGARLAYAAGPLTVAGSWGKMNKQLAMTDDLTTWNLGGRFNFGFATVGAMYEVSEYGIVGRTLEQKLATANIVVPMGAGQFKAQYTETGGLGAGATTAVYKAKMFGLAPPSLVPHSRPPGRAPPAWRVARSPQATNSASVTTSDSVWIAALAATSSSKPPPGGFFVFIPRETWRWHHATSTRRGDTKTGK